MDRAQPQAHDPASQAVVALIFMYLRPAWNLQMPKPHLECFTGTFFTLFGADKHARHSAACHSLRLSGLAPGWLERLLQALIWWTHCKTSHKRPAEAWLVVNSEPVGLILL